MDKKKIKKAKFSYQIINQYDPPAPALNVDIIANGTEKRNVLALLDSGSGITLMPENIIEELQPEIIDEQIEFGFIGTESNSVLYALKMKIPGLGSWFVKVASYSQLNYILIGRDILNKWSLLLEGRKKIFEIK